MLQSTSFPVGFRQILPPKGDGMEERSSEAWLSALQGDGSERDLALEDLRAFMLRGIMGYLNTRSDLQRLDMRDLEQLAQDTVQDALLKIQDKLETFKGRSKFTTWATKIAINHLISELRRQRWRDISLNAVVEQGTSLEDVITSGPGQQDDPSLTAEQRLVWQAVVSVLQNDLTERQRQAIVATQLNGVPLSEAAQMLDTNTNNLYKLLHDARLKIKKTLTAQGLEPNYILGLFSAE